MMLQMLVLVPYLAHAPAPANKMEFRQAKWEKFDLKKRFRFVVNHLNFYLDIESRLCKNPNRFLLALSQ